MPLFIANWKMYKTYDEAISFAKDHHEELVSLSKNGNQIIISPSFLCLDQFCKIFKGSSVSICAQNCSTKQSGPYTGEVDAPSLAQIGCQYTIVGHSERRHLFYETSYDIAAKIELLFQNKIVPIICIGETIATYLKGDTVNVLREQLESILFITKQYSLAYCIAYEPVWAIGTGKTPNSQELTDIFQWLSETVNDPKCTFLYGGSADEKNSAFLLQIPHVGGLLIGGASCNFQTLKKIVSLGQID